MPAPARAASHRRSAGKSELPAQSEGHVGVTANRPVHRAAMRRPGRTSPETCTLSAMSPSLIVADCPECRGIRTVILGVCDVCFAEFGENHDPGPWHDGPRLARTG